MIWACKIGERSYRLEDLDIGALEDFAAAHDTEWVNIIYSPLANLKTSKALVELSAEKMKVKPPWNGKGDPSFKQLQDCWETVADDIPESVDSDGSVPLEKAESPTES